MNYVARFAVPIDGFPHIFTSFPDTFMFTAVPYTGDIWIWAGSDHSLDDLRERVRDMDGVFERLKGKTTTTKDDWKDKLSNVLDPNHIFS